MRRQVGCVRIGGALTDSLKLVAKSFLSSSGGHFGAVLLVGGEQSGR